MKEKDKARNKNLSMPRVYVEALDKLAKINDRNSSSMVRYLIKQEAKKEKIWKEEK